MFSIGGRDILYLTHQQMRQFLVVIPTIRDRALFSLIYLYALRVSEAIRLQPADIDLEQNRITVRRLKGSLGGQWPIYSSIRPFLRDYWTVRQQTAATFFTGRQGSLTRQRVYQLFKLYAKAADLESCFSVRHLRHTMGTHLLESGLDLRSVQAYLGHVNIQNTVIYVSLTDRLRWELFQHIEKNPTITNVILEGAMSCNTDQ